MISTETLALLVGTLSAFFKEPITKFLNSQLRKLAAKLPWNKKKKGGHPPNFKKLAQIDYIIAAIGNSYHFDRVTLVCYSHYDPDHLPMTQEEMAKLHLTLTNEWADNTNKIMPQFQDVLCDEFADGMYQLNISPTGWLAIPPDNEPMYLRNNLTDVQNLYNVKKSYRFRLGKHITDGSVAVSFCHNETKRELTLQELIDISIEIKEIYTILKSKSNDHEKNV